MKGQQQLGIKGGYSLRVFKSDGREVSEKHVPQVNNVVTDMGMQDMIFSTNGAFRSATAVVGTGTMAITETSTVLGSLLKTSPGNFSPVDDGDSSAFTHTNNGDGTVTTQAVYTIGFNIGDFNGDSISEVGLASQNSSTLFAGQLIKDGNGNPTTITILSDEQLVVEYFIELTSWFTRQEVASGSITVNGVTSTYHLYVNPFLRDNTLSNSSDRTIFSKVDQGAYFIEDSTRTRLFQVDQPFAEFFTFDPISGGFQVNFSKTFSPSSFSSTDIKAVVLGNDSGNSTNPFVQRIGYVLEFDTPIEKTSSQAFTVDFSIDVTATQ